MILLIYYSIMSTLHLKYSTLKTALDKLLNRRTKEEYNNIEFIKKINITDIITFLPNDICNIINTYCYEKIILTCTIPSGDMGEYLNCTFTNKFYFNIFTNHKFVIYSSNSARVIQEDANDNDIIEIYSANICNEFMRVNYNKHNYFDVQHDIKVTYVADHPIFKNTILVGDTHTINGFKIRNCKQFKYMIIMIKCIILSMIKYKKMKQ